LAKWDNAEKQVDIKSIISKKLYSIDEATLIKDAETAEVGLKGKKVLKNIVNHIKK